MWACALLCLATPAGFATAQEGAAASAEMVFFEGLDLKEAGNCIDAVPLFQQALALDGGLHQARLYLAECAHWTGQEELAIQELERYLQIDFAEAEHDRARALLGTCKAALEAAPAEPAHDKPAAETPTTAETDEDPAPPADPPGKKDKYRSPSSGKSRAAYQAPNPAASTWGKARVGAGLALAHFANDAKLTTAGPIFSGHFLVARHVELSVRGRIGFGPYTERGGTVTLPQFGLGAAASIPLGKPRLGVGIVVPLAISKYDGETLADGGILGEVAIRVPVGDSRLVICGQFEGGYLVRAVVGGGLRVEVQLGPMGGES